MAKFHGKIGYGITQEDPNRPGVWKEEIIEKEYFGDIIKNTRKIQSSGLLNDNVIVSNDFSVIADSFAKENLGRMLYVEYMGSKWKIQYADVQYPRINLTVGEVYNG